MAKKKKEAIEIEEIKAPITPLSPVYANVVALFFTEDIVMLDFGFVAPNYREPHHAEDSQIARICLPWDSAETLSEHLNEVLSDHKKEQASKRKTKSKVKGKRGLE